MSDPSLQCLAAIASNGTEICGYVNGISTLLGAVITSFNGFWNYAKKLAALGIASMILGALIPKFVLPRIESDVISAVIVGWAAFLPLAVFGVWAFFLPSKIAWQRNRKRAKPIIVLNFLGVVPFAWHAALLWSTARNEEQSAIEPEGDIVQTNRLENKAIYQHADQVQQLLRQTGAYDAASKIATAIKHGGANGDDLSELEGILQRFFMTKEWPDEVGDEMRSLMAEIEAASRG